MSLELFSELQKAGFQQEAQYATLSGHILHCELSVTANNISKLVTLSDTNSPSAGIATQLLEDIAESHPLVVELHKTNQNA